MDEGMKCAPGMGHCGGCKCPHHKVVPGLIVLIGLAFLLQALNVVSAGFVGVVWPCLLILVGLQKMFSGMCRCCGMSKM